MASTTLGRWLINDTLPATHQVTGPMTNKQLHDHLVGLAKSDPAAYVRAVSAFKTRGDEVATIEGITVGLDDIRPDRVSRDKVVNQLVTDMAAEKDHSKHERLVIDAQTKLLAQTKLHPGSMTQMALSGARGNVPQLMKIVTTPLASQRPGGGIAPLIIRRSYAEGLTPAEYWTAAPEARANNVATVVSVSQPGEMAKLLIANTATQVITAVDCGTTNGLHLRSDDPHVLDRYLAAPAHGLPRGTLLTPRIIQGLPHGIELLVRSPLTCAATHGVCQTCMGLDEKGKTRAIGVNVGVRAAQALAEPLTQMALGSKHAVLMIREKKLEPQGLKGVRQLLEVPAAFAHEAVLAPGDGVLTRVEAAPQGGHFLWFTDDAAKKPTKLYVAPELTVRVAASTRCEAGDALTDGVPHPVKLATLKGLGAARHHLVAALQRTYAGEGVNLDRRHFELLARSTLNHVRVLDHDPGHPHLLKGEVLNYNAWRDGHGAETRRVPLAEAVGGHLGQEVFHHTFGTRVTPGMAKDLTARGVKDVLVTHALPRVEAVMKPLATNPLLDEDWMALLAHRGLKSTITRAASEGLAADLHGHHPVPAYAFGAELRRGADGSY